MSKWFIRIAAGAGLGVMYFILVHPLLMGTRVELILERESAMVLLFRGVPIICLTVIVFSFAALRRERHKFTAPFVIAQTILVPIPTLQYLLKARSIAGGSAGSIIEDVVLSVALLTAASILIALISRAVVPRLAQFVKPVPLSKGG